MKKNFLLTFLFVCSLLFILPSILFAQDSGGDPGGGINVPIGDVIMSLFTTFIGFAAGVILITGWIATNVLKRLTKFGKNILSWFIALIIGYIGYFIKIGIFDGIMWYEVLVIVFSFAIGSNKVYSTEWIRDLLILFKAAVPKKE